MGNLTKLKLTKKERESLKGSLSFIQNGRVIFVACSTNSLDWKILALGDSVINISRDVAACLGRQCGPDFLHGVKYDSPVTIMGELQSFLAIEPISFFIF